MIHVDSVKRDIEPQVVISRCYGGSDSFMSLEVRDSKSGQMVASVKLTLEQFAKCVSGELITADSGCVYLNDKIGRSHECERISVPMGDERWGGGEWNDFVEYAKAYCAGVRPNWVMDEIGSRNHHKISAATNGERTYEVVVRRWI